MTALPPKKEFIIRHTFDMRFNHDDDDEEITRFGIPWLIRCNAKPYNFQLFLACMLEHYQKTPYRIECDYEAKLIGGGKIKKKTREQSGHFVFGTGHEIELYLSFLPQDMKACLVKGELTVEFHLKNIEMTGVPNQDGDEDKNEEVTLVVCGTEIKVDPKFLASHSTYFNTLFFGASEHAGKTEIDLYDENPIAIMHFLKVLKDEEEIPDIGIQGMLEMAAKFGSQSLMKKCEDFLIEKSQQSLKYKFDVAVKYKLAKLKRKCMFQMKSKEDIREIASQSVNTFNASVWKELLQKSLSLQ